jgi:putative flippase GtrA
LKAALRNRALARWLKFNAVGGIGIIVQLSALALLKSACHCPYLAATGLAVEAAVLHNFIWHERFTWVDRPHRAKLARFLKFHLSTGAFSIIGNLGLMRSLVGVAHMNYLAANLLAVAVCSVLNFLVSDSFVFREQTKPGISEVRKIPGPEAPGGR